MAKRARDGDVANRQNGRHRIGREKARLEREAARDARLGDNSELRREGDELTRYRPKKSQEAIAVGKLAKQYDSPRKIAKIVGVSVDEVRRILSGMERA